MEPVIWESECEGTRGWKHACFIVNDSQLPLGIIAEPNCMGTTGALWKVFLCGPGHELYVEGGDEGTCCVMS